jgi:hypothetical protein
MLIRGVVVVLTAAILVPAAAVPASFDYTSTSRFMGSIALPGEGRALTSDGEMACAVTSTHLVCLDLRDPARPVVLGQTPLEFSPVDCVLAGDCLVVAATVGQLSVFDVSDPAAPDLVDSFAVPGPVEDFARQGELIIAAAGEAGVLVIDAADPRHLVLRAVLDTSDFASAVHGVASWGAHGAMAAIDCCLLEFDVSAPDSPYIIAVRQPRSHPEFRSSYKDVIAVGGAVFVASYESLPFSAKLDGTARELAGNTLLSVIPDVGGDKISYWDDLTVVSAGVAAPAGELALGFAGNSLVLFDPAQAVPRPFELAPLMALPVGNPVVAAAGTSQTIAVLDATGVLHTMPAGRPVAVPSLATFAAGETVGFANSSWAWSTTPQSFPGDEYTFTLWDLREPATPRSALIEECESGHHSTYLFAADEDRVVYRECKSGACAWTLADYTLDPPILTPIADVRGSNVLFDGDLLLHYGDSEESGDRGLEILDIAGAGDPLPRGFLALSGSLRMPCVVDHCLVAGTQVGTQRFLRVVDVSDPDAPTLIGHLPTSTYATLICGWDNRVLVGLLDGTLLVVEPRTLSTRGEIHLPGCAVRVARQGDLAWVAWQNQGLVALDLSDVAAPAVLSSTPLPSHPNGVAVIGEIAYVACMVDGVQAIDIRDPLAPRWLGGGSRSAYIVYAANDVLLTPGQTLPLHAEIPSPVSEPTLTPSSSGYLMVQPNPFNPRTEIVFDLPRDGAFDLSVFDVRGRRVRTLAAGDWPAGPHRVDWDGRDGEGRALSSGVYLVRLEGSGWRSVRDVQLLR